MVGVCVCSCLYVRVCMCVFVRVCVPSAVDPSHHLCSCFESCSWCRGLSLSTYHTTHHTLFVSWWVYALYDWVCLYVCGVNYAPHTTLFLDLGSPRDFEWAPLWVWNTPHHTLSVFWCSIRWAYCLCCTVLWKQQKSHNVFDLLSLFYTKFPWPMCFPTGQPPL